MSLPFTIDNPEGANQPTESAGRRGLHRLLPRTLTTRLAVGVVVLQIVLVSILGTGTYFALRSFLYGRLDTQVGQAASRNADSIQAGFANDPSGRLYLVYTGDRLWVSLVASNGTTANLQVPPSQRNAFAILDLSTDQKAWFIAHPDHPMSLSSNGEPLRAQSLALDDGNYMVVGLSTREVETTLDRLILLELIIGTAVIGIAAGLTAWGVRAGLRPLHRVTRTAQEVTAELSPEGSGLGRRVPVQGAAVEVEQVATSLNTLLQAVQTEFSARVRSEQRMRQFLADASHELRTPLTSIRGYAELSRLQSASGEAADDSMRRIELEGTRMSRLVEDLLVLARGDQDAVLEVAEVSVDALMAEAATAVHAAHPERTIEVAGPTRLTVLGDWDQLLRVLINLTTNAAVHTPGGPIRLGAAASTLAGPAGMLPAVALQVSDTGPGLPPEEAAHVFERFWRADKARSRAKGGSGLGMAIVAQIVQAHGGSIRFDSSVEHGTTVTALVPTPASFPYEQPPDGYGRPPNAYAPPDEYVRPNEYGQPPAEYGQPNGSQQPIEHGQPAGYGGPPVGYAGPPTRYGSSDPEPGGSVAGRRTPPFG